MATDKTPKNAPLTLEQQEGLLVADRVRQLDQKPIAGKFDAAHLRAINAYLFQDMKHIAGKEKEYTPGEYRQPVPQGQDWMKQRYLETVKQGFVVCYSRMDTKAQKELDEVLKGVNPKQMQGMKTAEFTKSIAQLYTQLDYLHPFKDGNSRTLRSFTSQLGKEAGFEVDWKPFAANQAGHDVLYVARDLGVNRIAVQRGLNSLNAERHVATQLGSLGGCQSLEQLLADKVRPLRAISFERDSKDFALSKHPELKSAFATLEKADKAVQGKYSQHPEVIEKANVLVRDRVQKALDAGEVSSFAKELSKAQPGKTKDAVRQQQQEPEKGLER